MNSVSNMTTNVTADNALDLLMYKNEYHMILTHIIRTSVINSLTNVPYFPDNVDQTSDTSRNNRYFVDLKPELGNRWRQLANSRRLPPVSRCHRPPAKNGHRSPIFPAIFVEYLKHIRNYLILKKFGEQ